MTNVISTIKLIFMKNYDLSQYMLREGNTLLFPLTQEEISLLNSKENFSYYIRLPYLAKKQSKGELDKISKNVDMENDYWFLNTQWVSVDVKAKAIVGYLRLEKIDDFNKIIVHLNDKECKSITKQDVINLFYKFLSVNQYYNIVVEDLDKKAVADEN